MRRYRIIKVEQGGESHYELQIRGFFCWITEQDGGWDDLGSYEYNREFKTEQEAFNHYNKYYTKPKFIIVKEG